MSCLLNEAPIRTATLDSRRKYPEDREGGQWQYCGIDSTGHRHWPWESEQQYITDLHPTTRSIYRTIPIGDRTSGSITLTCNVYFMGERMHRARKARRLNNYSKFSSPSTPTRRKLREPFSIPTSRPTRNKHPIKSISLVEKLDLMLPPAFRTPRLLEAQMREKMRCGCGWTVSFFNLISSHPISPEMW